MATWTTKVVGEKIAAAYINDLQTEKLDRDGDIPLTGDLDAGVHDISAGSFSIGVNKLTTAEFAHLDGQDQAVKTTSSPTFTSIITNSLDVGPQILDSTIIGFDAGNIGIATALHCVGIGERSLQDLTSADDTTAIGFESLANLTSGQHNTAVGMSAAVSLTTGQGNCAFGASALVSGGVSPCDYNCAFGYFSMVFTSTGYANCAYGYMSLYRNTTGGRNVAIGTEALYENLIGGWSVAVGFGAGNASLGDRCVFLGAQAGNFETLEQKLYIDNQSRVSEAQGRTDSLVYGIFDTVPANQRFRINGRFSVRYLPNYANDAAAGVGGLISGELYTVTGTDPLQVAAKV